jgi:hypothetical protein
MNEEKQPNVGPGPITEDDLGLTPTFLIIERMADILEELAFLKEELKSKSDVDIDFELKISDGRDKRERPGLETGT